MKKIIQLQNTASKLHEATFHYQTPLASWRAHSVDQGRRVISGISWRATIPSSSTSSPLPPSSGRDEESLIFLLERVLTAWQFPPSKVFRKLTRIVPRGWRAGGGWVGGRVAPTPLLSLSLFYRLFSHTPSRTLSLLSRRFAPTERRGALTFICFSFARQFAQLPWKVLRCARYLTLFQTRLKNCYVILYRISRGKRIVGGKVFQENSTGKRFIYF